jgi:predicted nucleic acid-binding protein
MILLDTSGLLAALFVDQRRHAECARVLAESEGPFVLSPFVLAELDYLVAKLAGEAVERELLAEVARGAYRLAEVDAHDVDEARSVIESHQGLGVGLADAMTVVLSRRLGCLGVLTLDERHFRVLRGFKDRQFRVLPADG